MGADRDLIAEANAFLDAADMTTDVEIFVRDGATIYEHMLRSAPRLVGELRAALEAAQQERDLAIAHDRQPYPTAWAYEQACKALEKHRERADAAEAALEVARRPPLGYIVLSRNPDTGRLQPHGKAHATAELARDWQRHLESTPGPRIPIRPGTQFLVAEAGEVQR